MNRLSNEFLEKLATEKKLNLQKIREKIDQELKSLVEEIARRHVE